jgi:hypothetical protein
MREIGAGGETCTPVEFPRQFTRLLLSLLSHAGEMVEHQGIAPCIPVWKTGVYLSTLMLGKIGIPCGNRTRLCGVADRRLC